MRWAKTLRLRLRSLLKRDHVEGEIDEELRYHLNRQIDVFIAEGMSPTDARHAAQRTMGGLAQRQEECRDALGMRLMDETLQDLRHAVRLLARNPGFTAVAVFTLALGIGATSAIFTVVNSVLLEPLPYPDADRLVRLMMRIPAAGSPTGAPLRRSVPLNVDEVARLRAATGALSQVGIAEPELVGLSGHEEAARLQMVRVTASALQLAGARPALGRLFTPEDEAADAEPVVLLSHSAWRRYFAGNPDVIGHPITFDSVLGPRRQTQHTVIGVMPEGFDFPRVGAQFWMPPPRGRRAMVGQLKAGVTIQAAIAELTPTIRQIRDGQNGNDVAEYELARLQDELVAPVRPALRALTIAVGFLLLIACINVANLLLARSAVRQREMAFRVALGAGRRRLARFLFTESLVLAMLGAVAGIGLAFGGVSLLRSLATTAARVDLVGEGAFPRLDEVAVDGTALMFACAVATATSLLFGLAPALRHSRANTVAHLRGGVSSVRSGFSRLSLRTVLVVAEVAAATVLLVGGALLVRSFSNLMNVDSGYDPTNVMTFQVNFPLHRFPDDRLRTFSEDLVARLRSVPGVESAAYANQLPTVGLRDTAGGLWHAPNENRMPTPLPDAGDARLVSRDYLTVMGIRIVAGRGFRDSDVEGQPRVLLVNETLAQRQFPGQDPIGRLVYIGRDVVPWEVVGVVHDVRQFGLDQELQPQFFIDMRQWPAANGLLFPAGSYFALRAAGDLVTLVATARTIVRNMDPEATLFYAAPMEDLVAATVSRPRMYAVLMGVFAAVGMALAVVGIYGVVAYSVAQRTHEIGIRMALGAQPVGVMGLVLRQSVVLISIGIGAGIAGAAAVTRYLEGLLFGLTPLDTATFALVAALFALVAIFASYVPARRATKIDPLVALRVD